MLYKRADEIWEMECDKCNMRLTEVIEGDMPLSGSRAIVSAWKLGWEITATKNICWGCADVSEQVS
jgi:hypothetical protein